MKLSLTTFALLAGAGAVGYWYATAKHAATLPPAPGPAPVPELPIHGIAPGEFYPIPVPTPPFARRLQPGSADALMLEQLLKQAQLHPDQVDRNAMASLAARLAADGYQIDSQRVLAALAALPPVQPAPQPQA